MTKSNYKVIEILNSKELIINYGSNQGAKKGKEIRISIKGEPVIDPETEVQIGTLDIIKGELEIYQTYPNFSICRSIQRRDRNILGSPFIRSETFYNSLNVNSEDMTHRLPANVPPIKVGDKIELV